MQYLLVAINWKNHLATAFSI